MREYQELLNGDPGFAARYREAHSHYVAARNAVQDVTEISQVSAGGMPDRVKCLHALVGHSLATGPGVNPVGDLAVGVLMTAGSFPHEGDCVHNSEVS